MRSRHERAAHVRGAVGIGRRLNGLEQGFGQGALGAVGGRSHRTAREAARRTTRTARDVRGQPRLSAAQLGSGATSSGDRSVVRQESQFHVGGQNGGLLDLLPCQGLGLTGNVRSLHRVGDDASFGEDLRAVADAGGLFSGGERHIITLLGGIGRSGAGRIGFPLAVGLGDRGRTDGRGERGGVGADLVDLVFEVFAQADGGVGGLGIGRECHGD